MVAPSFQSMTVVSEVYTKDGKQHIDVRNEKTGTIRHVRWYTEAEYNKLYNKRKNKREVHFTSEQIKFYKPAAVRSIEVSGTNPRIIKASVTADPLLAPVFIWQAYGALIKKS